MQEKARQARIHDHERRLKQIDRIRDVAEECRGPSMIIGKPHVRERDKDGGKHQHHDGHIRYPSQRGRQQPSQAEGTGHDGEPAKGTPNADRLGWLSAARLTRTPTKKEKSTRGTALAKSALFEPMSSEWACAAVTTSMTAHSAIAAIRAHGNEPPAEEEQDIDVELEEDRPRRAVEWEQRMHMIGLQKIWDEQEVADQREKGFGAAEGVQLFIKVRVGGEKSDQRGDRNSGYSLARRWIAKAPSTIPLAIRRS